MRFMLFIFLEATSLLKDARGYPVQIEDDRVIIIIIDNVGIAGFANRALKSRWLAERLF